MEESAGMNAHFWEASLFWPSRCSLFYISVHSKWSSSGVEPWVALWLWLCLSIQSKGMALFVLFEMGIKMGEISWFLLPSPDATLTTTEQSQCITAPRLLLLETEMTRAPEWCSWLSVPCLLSAWVMISGLWDWALHQAVLSRDSAWGSLSPPPSAPPAYVHMLSQNKSILNNNKRHQNDSSNQAY